MCYHGLGHGIFAFYSYSFPETVELCGKTGTPEYRNREATECVGGAVMELSGGGGHDREAWNVAREKYLNDTVGLCMGPYIPDDTKSQCLTYITRELWRVAGIDLGKPQPELFEKAFALCDVIPRSESALRKSCYGGFGKEFVPLALGRDIREIAKFGDRETETVEKWCASAPLQDARVACMEQAVQSLFWGGENDPNITFRFCAYLQDGDLQTACYKELAVAIDSYTFDDRKSILCAQVPAQFQNRCLQ